jgi:predicted benzoate:H+ symporter BenE
LNKIALDKVFIRKKFDTLERNALIMMAIPLPFFALSYLFTTSSTISYQVPDLPLILDTLLLTLVIVMLGVHYFNFRAAIKSARLEGKSLEDKVLRYSQATMKRLWVLFVVILLCAAGLLVYQNPGYTISFAIALVFFSLGKPTPDRIIRLLKLRGEEKEEIEALKIRNR